MIRSGHKLIFLAICLVTGQIMAAQPGDVAYNLGDIAFSKGDWSVAAAEFRKARDLYEVEANAGRFLECHWMLLDCLEKRAAYSDLDEELRNVTEKSPVLQNADPALLKTHAHVCRLFKFLLARAQGDLNRSARLLTANIDSLYLAPDDGNNFARLFKSYIYLSEVELERGNTANAEEQAMRAIRISETFRKDLYPDGSVLIPHRILHDVYMEQGNYQQASAELRTILRYIPLVEERRTERTIDVYRAAHELNLKRNYLDSARHYLIKIYDIDKERFFEHETVLLHGAYLREVDSLSEALEFYRDARKRYSEASDGRSERIASIDIALGQIYLETGDPDQALTSFHRALFALADEEAPVDLGIDPPADALFEGVAVLDAIIGKARAVSLVEGADAEQAWSLMRLATGMLESLRSTYTSSEDKSLLIEKSYGVYGHGIRLCFDRKGRQWTDSAFVLMEECKALNLLESLRSQSALSASAIPDSLVRLKLSLLAEINACNSQLRRVGSDGTRQEIVARRSAVYHRRDSLQRFLQEQYPTYQRFAGQKIPSLSEIQGALSREETLVEFFTGDDYIYVITADRTRRKLHRLDRRHMIGEQVTCAANGMADALDGTLSSRETSQLLETLDTLYRYLVRPILPLRSRLIIIPDGELWFVPFAALPTSRVFDTRDLRKVSFMALDFDIGYSPSSTFWLQLRNRTSEDNPGAIAFVPRIDPSSGYENLRYCQKEVDSLRRKIGARVIRGDACTPEAVRNILDTTRLSVAHFATHAYADRANGLDSYLVCSGEDEESRLFAHELYGIDMHTQLVFLSACETGGGNVRLGEGVISLARAFLFAGARNLVTTQWSISDRLASRVTGLFYKHWSEGRGVTSSLANAQRSFLRSLSDEERYLAHPAFWAAFISMGSDQATEVYSPLAGRWIYALLGIAIALTVIFFLRKE